MFSFWCVFHQRAYFVFSYSVLIVELKLFHRVLVSTQVFLRVYLSGKKGSQFWPVSLTHVPAASHHFVKLCLEMVRRCTGSHGNFYKVNLVSIINTFLSKSVSNIVNLLCQQLFKLELELILLMAHRLNRVH